jgi:hypothetical protein
LATWWAGAIGTAVGVSTYLAILTITGSFVAVAPAGIPLAEVVRAFARPLVVGVVAAGAGALASRSIPAVASRDWAVLTVACAVAAPVYVLLIRWVAPSAWHELTSRMATPLQRWRATAAVRMGDSGNT